MKFYPDDINVRFMRAQSYRNLKMFEESINDLKYNLGIKDNNSINTIINQMKENPKLEINDYSLSELYFIYYHLNMYREAMELLPLVYETKCIRPMSVHFTELVMRTQLGLNVKSKNYDNMYVYDQIINYNSEEAIKQIKEYKNQNDKRSKFKNDIDLNYLFNLITNNINNDKKVNITDILEIHYFSIANVGYFDNMPCSFIKVVVIPNTNNIINMYPTNEIDYSSVCNIEYEIDKLFPKKEEKVKTLSRIDKFNKKYNI